MAHVHFDNTEDERTPRLYTIVNPISVPRRTTVTPLVMAAQVPEPVRRGRTRRRFARSAINWRVSRPSKLAMTARRASPTMWKSFVAARG